MVEGGETSLQPLNMTEVGSDEEPDTFDERSAVDLLKPVIQSTARRLAKVESQALSRAIKKHLEAAGDGVAFITWANEYYGKHADVLAEAYTPIVESLMVAHGRAGDAGIEARELAIIVASESIRGVSVLIEEASTPMEAAGELRRIVKGLPEASSRDITSRLVGDDGGICHEEIEEE